MLTLHSFLTSSFGQRYTRSNQAGGATAAHTPQDADIAGAGNVASGNKRTEKVCECQQGVHGANAGSNNDSDEQECVICAETKLPHEFPPFTITSTCNHATGSCLDCIKKSIKADLDSKVWTDIRCPECNVAFDYLDIQKYADDETFSR